jgi:hypothetical protein
LKVLENHTGENLERRRTRRTEQKGREKLMAFERLVKGDKEEKVIRSSKADNSHIY